MNKVVHIITRFIKGGADFNTLYTLEGISKEFKSYLITGTTSDPELVEEIKNFGVKVRHTSLKHYNSLSALQAFLEIFLLLKKIKPRIVHTHSTEAGIVGRWAAWFAKVPIIIHTNHGVPFNRNFFAKKTLIFLEKLTAKITTKIISNADTITEQFLKEKIGKKEQYLTIYSGVDLEQIKNSKPDQVIKKRKKIKVLCASRLVKWKGLEDFIKVAKQINQENKIFEFYIAGDGPLREQLIKQAKDNVIFLGHQDNLPSIMKASTLFVLPSYREGTPRVITEALACNLPVIATNIDGIPEQITNNENGLLFEPGDLDQLKSLILNKDWKKLKPELNKNFDKKIMIKQIKELYQTIN